MKYLALVTPISPVACGGEPGDNAASGPSSAVSTTAVSDVPARAKDAVWYQIFPERFRNGDSTNDPTLHDIEGAWPHMAPEGWEPTAWTQDWFRQEPRAAATGEDIYTTIQLRRCGGDLQGVIDRLDDAATPDTNEFASRGWAGVPELPEWRKPGRPENAHGGAVPGTLDPEIREHVFAVTRRRPRTTGSGGRTSAPAKSGR